MRLFIFIWFVLFGVLSCVPVTDNPEDDIVNYDVKDPNIRKILDFGHQAKTDSLYSFLRSIKSTERYAAARAFASIKDKESVDSLANLLQDKNDEIRAMAAYAIGQTNSSRAEELLIQAYNAGEDSLELYLHSNATILESIGKCGAKKYLNLICQIQTLTANDTILLMGQVRAIYRFALREITSPISTQLMVDYVTNHSYPNQVRIMAANYLYRAKNIDLEPFVHPISKELTSAKDARIRMCLAIALGKAGTTGALEQISKAFTNEADYRVKANLIRSLQNYSYQETRNLVFSAIEDEHPGVRLVAANHILNYGIEDEALSYRQFARDRERQIEIRAKLYAAANRLLPAYYAITKGNINAELKALYDETKDPYHRAAIIEALGEEALNVNYIKEKSFDAPSAVVRSAGVSALGRILRTPYFLQSVSRNPQRAKEVIADYLKEAIMSKDASMIAIASEILRDESLKMELYFEDLTPLEEALSSLSLPDELDTYNELKHTISYFQGNDSFVPEKSNNLHGIDWTLVDLITDSTVVEVITNKGIITLKLYQHHSPGTVSNFIKLIKKNFYNGKFFHRVVPNFVVQTGCPDGDGYGSLDYSIRSELGPKYYDDEGYIGMASSGNHTECTQWFITHSPTPHLDGNYTLFGKVISGIEVVHLIEIGDVIQEIKLHHIKS